MSRDLAPPTGAIDLSAYMAMRETGAEPARPRTSSHYVGFQPREATRMFAWELHQRLTAGAPLAFRIPLPRKAPHDPAGPQLLDA